MGVSRLKILHIALTGGWAGSERIAFALANNQAQNNESEVYIAVRTNHSYAKHFYQDQAGPNVHIIEVPTQYKGAEAIAEFLRNQLCSNSEFDIVHGHLGIGCRVAAYFGSYSYTLGHLHVRFMTTQHQNLDGVVAVSEWQIKDIPSWYKGDVVLVPIYGRFGHLLVEIAQRYGAKVVTLETDWGQVFSSQTVVKAIKEVKPKIVAMVHGETSTACMQPLAEIGKVCRQQDSLFIVDAVATLGGAMLKVDEWFIDACIAGTQKCLSVPAGMAPITFNERVEKIILQRKRVEQGLADTTAEKQDLGCYIRTNYFDLSQLMDYWSPVRLNHHTEATTMLYGLYEGLRLVLAEGLDARFARHKKH